VGNLTHGFGNRFFKGAHLACAGQATDFGAAMNVHQAIATFASYSPQAQTDFLVRLAHALTILARDTYDVGREGLTHPARLRLLNEVEHRVTGFLLALMKNDPQRYPDDVLVRIILEHPEDVDLQRQLQETFGRLTAQTEAAA
jgi:hypothetical protein